MPFTGNSNKRLPLLQWARAQCIKLWAATMDEIAPPDWFCRSLVMAINPDNGLV